MATFNSTYGPTAMMSAVSECLSSIEQTDPDMNIHTVTLVLNGNHGEFNLTIEATHEDMEDHTWVGVAHRYGGVSQFAKVEEG